MIALFKEFLPHLKVIKKDKLLVNNINNEHGALYESPLDFIIKANNFTYKE